jgi:threonine synthase
MSYLRELVCAECGKAHAADRLQSYCRACTAPLLAHYDLAGVRAAVTRTEFRARPPGIWRWSELLPVREKAHRRTLGEGDSPLLRLARLGEALGLPQLYLKDEGLNPGGTFKARGLAVAVARAWELGARHLSLATAGNAGGALAAYAAACGAAAHVFMPGDAAPINQREVQLAGAELVLIDGLIDEATARAQEAASSRGWFDMSTCREPYRVEGKKTMGFELAEAFDWQLPDVVVFPTGGGVGMIGMWKGFGELRQLGWIGEKLPRMVSVQAAGCAPLVRALARGEQRIKSWASASTAAGGLRVPKPFADRLLLQVIRESGGTALAVSDDEMRQAQAELASREGVLACLEGAASLAGLPRLCQAGFIGADECVVLFNTGSGLKCMP